MEASIRSNSPLSFIGIIVGFVALAAVVLQFSFGPFSPRPPVEKTVAERAVAFGEAARAVIRGEEFPAPERERRIDLDELVLKAAIVGGLIAIALALVGLMRRERLRFAVAAGALGTFAITLQIAVVLFATLAFAILVAATLGQLELDL